MKKSLFLRLFAGYAAVIVLLAAAATLFAPPLLRTHHVGERAAELEHLAHVLEGQVLPYLAGTPAGDLEGLVTDLGRKTATRITVIGADGGVLADSEREPRDMENHLFRPEIQASLRGETQMSIRPSSTLKADMMYMSIPLRSGGRVVGALRLSVFMKDIEALLDALRTDLLTSVGLAAVFALLLSVFLARSVAVPTREVMDASKRIAAGDLDVSVSMRRRGEFLDFARSFNALTGRLRQMSGEIRLQSAEIDSILGSILEGVCVLDGSGRILLANASFRRIVGRVDPDGLHFWEAARSSGLQELVRKARQGTSAVSGDVTLGDRRFSARVVPLAAEGRLVVTICESRDATTEEG
jgi:two-component system, OmpR family, phosphate regulon sensor histidine kinase PhoR